MSAIPVVIYRGDAGQAIVREGAPYRQHIRASAHARGLSHALTVERTTRPVEDVSDLDAMVGPAG